MQKDEFYIEHINGNMDRNIMGCPFIVSGASVIQSIMMISIIYKSALNLEDTLMTEGHKMDEHTLEAFNTEVNRLASEILIFKAGIEN